MEIYNKEKDNYISVWMTREEQQLFDRKEFRVCLRAHPFFCKDLFTNTRMYVTMLIVNNRLYIATLVERRQKWTKNYE